MGAMGQAASLTPISARTVPANSNWRRLITRGSSRLDQHGDFLVLRLCGLCGAMLVVTEPSAMEDRTPCWIFICQSRFNHTTRAARDSCAISVQVFQACLVAARVRPEIPPFFVAKDAR